MSKQYFDDSQYNIVYEFKADNILTISGEIESPFQNRIGEHSYSITDSKDGRMLTIDYTTWWFSVSSQEFEISLAPLDGGIYRFVKLKNI